MTNLGRFEMKTFREAVCERFDVAEDAYEEEVLWRSIFPHAQALARVLWKTKTEYFDDDIELIRNLADCTSIHEVRMELNDFRYHRPLRGVGRRLLRVRVSGQRLMHLATLVLR